MSIYGGIEAGGTKFVCVVGSKPEDVRAEESFPTTTPRESIDRAIAFLQRYQEQGSLVAVGIGSFGPIDLDPESPTYGYITTTPKQGWARTDFVGRVRQALRVPVGFDTDVNAAVLAEAVWGAGRGFDTFVYLTVGTGVGGGAMVNGQLLHGLLHPEMGHIRVPHDWKQDPYMGACPFHGDCLEGLVAGPALAGRWGQPGESLPRDHQGWALVARYVALALVNLICTLSPRRIVLGGGIMQQKDLFTAVRRNVQALLNGYVDVPAVSREIDEYIVPAELGNRAGALGAIVLAKRAVGVSPNSR